MLLEQQASSRENWRWMGILSPLLTQGTRSGISLYQVLRVICWWDEAHILGRQKSRANTSSLWGRRGDRSHRFINSYNVEEGRTVKGLVFPFPHSKTLLGSICSFVLGSPHSNSLDPFDTLLMSNYLNTSLLRHWGTQSQRKRGKDHSGVFGLYRVSWGSGFPLPVLCQDAFTEGDENPWNDRVACFSIVWVLARKYSCQTITWRFAVF